MKNFSKLLIVFSSLIGITLIFLIFGLRSQENIVYTDEETAKSIPTILRTDPHFGAKDPQVIIIHYGDFECETCADTAYAVNAVAAQYPDDVLVIWKDFPNQSLHPNATSAAVAARCAEEQNKFWEFHNYLMNHQATLGKDLYTMIADELGLRTRKFNTCLEKEQTLNLVQASYQESMELNLTAPPTIFINNETFTGRLTELDIRLTVQRILQ